MKDNYVEIDYEYLKYNIEKFIYVYERKPKYLVVNSDTLELMTGPINLRDDCPMVMEYHIIVDESLELGVIRLV